MILEYCAIGLVLSVILLIPLGWKWCIRMRIVIFSSILIGLLSGLINYGISGLMQNLGWTARIIMQLFFIFALTFSGILYRFFRDPERSISASKGAVLSPADGEVIYIRRINQEEHIQSNKKGRELPVSEEIRNKYFPNPVYVIGISMNFLHVHVNRAPIGGRVEFLQHMPGKFLSLRKQEAYHQNERALTVIENDSIRVGVIQIASRLVRRILSFIEMNDTLQRGQRIGKITLGSQVDVILPISDSLHLETMAGQEIKAGLTTIARYEEQ